VTTQRVSSASPYEAHYGFCRALRRGNHVFVAGTAPINPDGSSCPKTATDQARRCFTIMLDALQQLGGTSDDVVRTRMFITNAEDRHPIGEVHGEFFAENPPVATMVVVASLLDPRWKCEMELEAFVAD